MDIELENIDNIEYWRDKRAVRVASHWSKADTVNKRLIREYSNAQVDITNEIEKLYGRYAGNAGMTYTEATQYLNGKEVAAFQSKIAKLKDTWIETGDPTAYQQYKAIATRKRITRLEALNTNINFRLSELGGYQSEVMEKSLVGIYQDNFKRAIYEVNKGTGYTSSFATIDEVQIKKLIEAPMPITGSGLSESIWGNVDNLSRTIKQELIKGTMAGDSIQKMSKRIATKTSTAMKNATRLVRTETSFVIGQSDLDAYNEMGIEKYQYFATLDEVTAEIDGSLDGENFPVKDAQVGVNYPPMHPNCRCDTVPYIDNSYAERVARDVETGRSVAIDGDITYTEWKKLVA